MVCITSDEGYLCSVPLLFFVSWIVVSDHVSTDPVATPINATGHHFETLCRSICAEEKAQILDPSMSNKCCLRITHVSYLTYIHHTLDGMQN